MTQDDVGTLIWNEVQLLGISELCHRMTVAETREVRMQLCKELKAAIVLLLRERG